MDFQSNQIHTLGRIFDDFQASGLCALDLSDNRLNETSLQTALTSFTHSVANLYVTMAGNSVTEIPGRLFDGVSSATPHDRLKYLTISVDLSRNPVRVINTSCFSGVSYLLAVALDLSNPTAGHIMTPADQFSYHGVGWDPILGGTLNLSLVNTGVEMSIVGALSVPTNGPQKMTLSLRSNNYTVIGPHSLSTSRATSLDLTYNHITHISPVAFR